MCDKMAISIHILKIVENDPFLRLQMTIKEMFKHDLVEFKVQCLKAFCYHGNKSTILLFIQFLEQLLKFLANFTLLKYVKSQRSYGFLITKELIFGFQILNLKVHFSASLISACIFHRGFFGIFENRLLFGF